MKRGWPESTVFAILISSTTLITTTSSRFFSIILEKELNEHLLSIIKIGHFSYLKSGIDKDEKTTGWEF